MTAEAPPADYQAVYQELLARELNRPELRRELSENQRETETAAPSRVRAVMPALDERYALVIDENGQMRQLTRQQLRQSHPDAYRTLMTELNQSSTRSTVDDDYLQRRWQELQNAYSLSGQPPENHDARPPETTTGAPETSAVQKTWAELTANLISVNDFLQTSYEQYSVNNLLARYERRRTGEQSIPLDYERLGDNLPAEEALRRSGERASRVAAEEIQRLGVDGFARKYCLDFAAFNAVYDNPAALRALEQAYYDFKVEMVRARCPHRVNPDGTVDGLEPPSPDLRDYQVDEVGWEDIRDAAASLNPLRLVKALDGRRFGNIFLEPFLDPAYNRSSEFREAYRLTQDLNSHSAEMDAKINQAIDRIAAGIEATPGQTLDEQIAFVDTISQAVHELMTYDLKVSDRSHKIASPEQYRRLMLYNSAVNRSEVCRSYVQLAREIIERKSHGTIKIEDLAVGALGGKSNHLAFAATFDLRPGESSRFVVDPVNRQKGQLTLIWDPTWGRLPDANGDETGPAHMGVEEFYGYGERVVEGTLVDIGYNINLPAPDTLAPRLHPES